MTLEELERESKDLAGCNDLKFDEIEELAKRFARECLIQVNSAEESSWENKNQGLAEPRSVIIRRAYVSMKDEIQILLKKIQ